MAAPGAHLNLPEIEQAANDALSPGAASDHLAVCGECQETVEFFRSLGREPTAAPEGHVCLSPEEFARLSAPEAAEDLLLRAAECATCSAALRAAFPDDLDATPTPVRKPGPKAARQFWIAIAACLLAACTAALWWSLRAPEPQVLLARAYTASRPFEYRLPDAGYGRVTQQRAREVSVFARPTDLVEAETLLARLSQTQPAQPALLLFKGRAELLEGRYEAAIASFTQAGETAGSPELWTDLACAYAVRGDTEKRKEDYARGAELLLRSVRADDKQARAWFNLGLVYQRLWLVEEAVSAWKKFVALDGSSPWAAEARRHLAELEEILKKKGDLRGDRDLTPEAFRAAASAGSLPLEPELNSFWTRWLLPSLRAGKRRDAVAWFAHAVAQRHGDPSAEAAVKLASNGDSAGLAALAAAIGENLRGNHDEALLNAKRAAESMPEPMVGDRAIAEVLSALQRTDRVEECIERGRQFLRRRPRAAWPRIQGEMDFALCLGKSGDLAGSRSLMQAAIDDAGRSGFSLLRLRGLGLLSSIDVTLGASGSTWSGSVEGLESYWKSAAPLNRFHQFAFDMARVSSQVEWWNLAGVLSEAHIHAAGRIPNRSMEALGAMQLAAMLEQSGDRPASRIALTRALPLIASIEDAGVRRVYDVEARVARARSLAESAPNDAIALLRDIQPESVRSEILRRRLEQVYGHALLQSGDWRAARERLRLAKAWVAGAGSLSPARRLDVLNMAEPMYRDLVRVEWVHAHSPEAAFRIWSEFRDAASPMRGDPVRPARDGAQIVLVVPGGEVRGWISHAGGTREFQAGDSADAIRRQAAVFLRECSSAESSLDDAKHSGAVLFRQLLGGVAAALAASANWRIDADGWLAQIPFEALVLPDGRFVAEEHAVAYGSRPLEGAPHLGGVFVVAVSSARGFEGNRLPALHAASREASRIAARFGVSRRGQPSVSPSEVLEGIAHAEVFHFAGHGWSNGGGGGLLLGDDAGRRPQIVAAADLAGADLSRCRLAVLSACLTAAGESRGPINPASLVRALLGAGVRNVIASRWNADDGAAAALFDEFYERLAGGAAPAAALRAASVKLLSALESRHPYYWAAFSLFS